MGEMGVDFNRETPSQWVVWSDREVSLFLLHTHLLPTKSRLCEKASASLASCRSPLLLIASFVVTVFGWLVGWLVGCDASSADVPKHKAAQRDSNDISG